MKKLLILTLLCFLFGAVSAQDSNELIKKLVEKNILTQSEADELKSSVNEEKKSKTTQTVEKVRNIFNSPYIQLGGNGQLMYQYSDVNKTHHDFKAKNLFLSLNGKLNESFRYGFLLEMVNPSVQEFWGEWTAAKEFNLKVGQFKSPFTLESQLVPATLETAAYSRTISNLVGYAGDDDVLKKQNNKNNFGRDAGVMISGELLPLATHNLLQYSAGLFQGTGVTTGETNNGKDFAGMLLLQPLKGLRVGGGVYFGQASYFKAGEAESADHVRDRWYVSADYKSDRVYARTEWIHANDGGIDKEGIYGLGLFYLIPQKLNVLGKVDYYNSNKDINREAIDYTLGINYYFYPMCRVQLNYTYSDYSNKWDAPNSNVVVAQLQVAF
ncbi:porin [Prevotella sp. 10(H)]|uniref:porin n=1 Tax=Prevotella sp. 10(H) TaxID=1158294 RepID=UPI0004A6ABD8|nr:porin [Prevotella sp. 10(H)]